MTGEISMKMTETELGVQMESSCKLEHVSGQDKIILIRYLLKILEVDSKEFKLISTLILSGVCEAMDNMQKEKGEVDLLELVVEMMGGGSKE